MTAVAPPPSFQPVPRAAWHSTTSGQGNLDSMSTEEVSRMFMPRKGLQRTNSSSSVGSSSSSSSSTSTSTSTITAQTPQQNGGPLPELSGWASRKKPARSLWPSAKSEAASGISTARPQSVTAQGQAQAAPMSHVYQPPHILPSQHVFPSQQQNGARGNSAHGQGEGNAVLCLLPMNGTFERKTINVPFFPEVLRIGRQTNAKTVPTPLNGYFDSKVLSRQHAEIWADKLGKIWIRDVKSSNGTFVNGQRLSRENHDSEPHELRDQDILELGIDIISEDQKSVVHHKVAARVEHAGFYGNETRLLDINSGDMDPTAGGMHLASSQGIRGRAGSHGNYPHHPRFGSMAAAYPGHNVGAVGQQRHVSFWLTPITIEQIVKRLTTELKAAKQQSFDLQRTGEYFDALLTHGSAKDEPKLLAIDKPSGPQATGVVLKAEPKTRFSDPPAPPPQQPLPEKPDAAREDKSDSLLQGLLQRSDTERPKAITGSSPTKGQSSQIGSLVEALASAKREIEEQGARVKSLEDMLQEERTAREHAESRAKRLEARNREEIAEDSGGCLEDPDTGKLITPTQESDQGTDPEIMDPAPHQEPEEDVTEATSDRPPSEGQQNISDRLQQRLESMMAEMHQMRQTMETYRLRAEAAERENASTRQSLAEMVEQIRRNEAERETRRAEDHTASDPTQNPGQDALEDGASTLTFLSAHRIGQEILRGDKFAPSGGATSSLTRMRHPNDHFVQSAPYASILGVVALGVGLMAYLNGWQKMDR